jgi:hypothetical protein
MHNLRYSVYAHVHVFTIMFLYSCFCLMSKCLHTCLKDFIFFFLSTFFTHSFYPLLSFYTLSHCYSCMHAWGRVLMNFLIHNLLNWFPCWGFSLWNICIFCFFFHSSGVGVSGSVCCGLRLKFICGLIRDGFFFHSFNFFWERKFYIDFIHVNWIVSEIIERIL